MLDKYPLRRVLLDESFCGSETGQPVGAIGFIKKYEPKTNHTGTQS